MAQSIPSESFQECFSELCRVLWKILHNYHCVVNYHLNEAAVLGDLCCLSLSFATTVPLNSGGKTSGAGDSRAEDTVAKFKNGMSSVWNSALNAVNTLISGTDLSGFKFDHFLDVVSMANRYRIRTKT